MHEGSLLVFLSFVIWNKNQKPKNEIVFVKFFGGRAQKQGLLNKKKIELIMFFTFMCLVCVRMCVMFVHVYSGVYFMSMSLCSKPAAKQKWEFLRGWDKDG